MKKITREWLNASNDDLLMINEVIEKEYLTHLVAFHSQQAIEKALKAVFEEFTFTVPKVHNLERLFNKANHYIELNYDDDIVLELDKLYTDSRYPGEFGLLPDGKPNLKDTREFYDYAKVIFETIETFLNKRANQ